MKENQSFSKQFQKISFATISSITMVAGLVVGGASAASAVAPSEAPSPEVRAKKKKAKKSKKPKLSALKAGSVGFSEYTSTNPQGYVGPDDKRTHYRTIWAFSVKNNSKKWTALNPSARVVLKSKTKTLSFNVRVAGKVGPKSTVWVAPDVRGDMPITYAPIKPKQLDARTTGITGVVSAKATIIRPGLKWTKKKAGKLHGAISMATTSDIYRDRGYGGYTWKDLNNKDAEQVIATASKTSKRKKQVNIYSTYVIRDWRNKVIGGLRPYSFWESSYPNKTGKLVIRFLLPWATANDMVSIHNYTAWK